jgi:hypothetical protein
MRKNKKEKENPQKRRDALRSRQKSYCDPIFMRHLERKPPCENAR